MATLGSFGRLSGVQLRQDIRAVDEHTCLVICEVAKFNNFCPTLTLPHEFINISTSMPLWDYYISVWLPKCETIEKS